LKICEKCGSPKEHLVVFGGKSFLMPQMCRCEADKFKKEDYEFKHKNKVRELTRACFYPTDLSNKTFENDDGSNEELIKIAKTYVEEYAEHRKNGTGLLFFGECDVGKTYACACIANALIEKEIPVRMTSFPAIANAVQGWGEKEEYIDHLLTFQVLIIDDLKAERETQYMNELVYEIINLWINTGKPLLITTNLTAEQLKRPKDITNNRVFSRIFEKCIPFEVKGTHHRNKICAENKARFMENLKW
jgi:DNA replication protein DnaC